MLDTVSIHSGSIDAQPETLGLDQNRLAELNRHFSSLIEAGKLQGASYLVAKDGKIVAHHSLGRLTYHDNSTDLEPDSIRQVYSITKAFTSVAIARLVEEGKLYYKQPVSTWIKEFDTDYHRDITLWHLLTHTSGLMPDPGCLQEPYPFPWYGWWVHEKREKSDHWSAGEWIKLILGGRMAARPGEQWNYCTAGYAILGEVIARVSGRSYEQYIKEYITDPLGMEHTFMDVPKPLQSKVCYVSPWEEHGLKESTEREDLENSAASDEMPPAAGNGLFSTLHDLWKFGQCMLDGGTFNGHTLLGRRTVENMVSNQLSGVPSKCWGDNNQDYRMSLGWSLNDQDICSPGTYSHEGAGHCGLYIDPKERLIYVFFVPSKTGWVPEAVINPRAIVWSSLL